MENVCEKRLFFVVFKLRPTEAHFKANKKRSLSKLWNGMREIASKEIVNNFDFADRKKYLYLYGLTA